MFGGGGRWLRFSKQFRYHFPTTSFSTNAKNTPPKNNKNNDIVNISDERYKQLENLNMETAFKMLFTDPPQKKKFGFDFHLVQFFFACLPSFAVYLVAQYARYEIRIMEVEVEQKRKEKEEKEAKEKEKEMELNPPDPKLLEVKERLEKLEEAVKEIVDETKKKSSNNLSKNQVNDDKRKHPSPSASTDTSSGSELNKAKEENHLGKRNSLTSKPESGEESKGSVATPNSSLQDPKGQSHSGGGS